jgi:hypothetical protein
VSGRGRKGGEVHGFLVPVAWIGGGSVGWGEEVSEARVVCWIDRGVGRQLV